MGEYVRVESVEALKKFRAALCKFAEDVTVGLNEADAEIQRTTFWLKQEQRNYWKGQERKRAELYARAKSELSRKKMQTTALGGRFSYIDEQKALAAAERRLDEARQKLANVRRWSRALDEESFSYKAVAQGLSQTVELDVPNALAQLDNMIVALEAYASSAALSEQASTAAAAVTAEGPATEEFASMARAAPAPPRPDAESYRPLRTRTPSQAVRDEALVGKPVFDRPKADTGAQDMRAALAGLDLARTPIAADDKIIVAREAGQRQRIYLERVRSAAPGDSGWCLGVTDDTRITGYEAARIADLLAGRPDLEAVLELPVGCLVVLAGTSLEAVLDPQDTLLWPARAPAQPR